MILSKIQHDFLCSQHELKTKKKYLRQVAEVWKDIHVPEAVNGNNRTVCGSLLNVEERVPEFVTVSMEEVYCTLKL